MNIEGAVIVVTGASSGIGEATARAASRAGAKVVLAARRLDRIEALAEELGDALAVQCDVTDADQVSIMIDAALEKFGRIDVVLNIAGQGLQASVDKIALDDFRAVLELNTIAPLTVMQAALPALRTHGGAIVNVSSGITFGDIPGSAAYAASKAALSKLTGIARAELASDGIVVSVIYPFVTRTEFTQSVRAGKDAAATLEADHAPDPQTPEQVAAAILDLVLTGAAQADMVPVQLGGSYTAPTG